MSMPGWYPDPAGNLGHFRYWDGAQWSSGTTTDPGHEPVPPASGPPPRRGWGWIVAIIATVLVAVVAAVVVGTRQQPGAAAPVDTNTAAPTVSAWNETSTPTPQPSSASQPAPSQGTLISCPSDGGTSSVPIGGVLQAGGLQATAIPGWTLGGFSMSWARATEAVTDPVYPGWFSVASVSALSTADGFESPRQSAQAVMSCFASSSYYMGFTGRQDLMSQQVSINGHPGWRLRSDIYVNLASLPQVQGDVVNVIVVDTGSPGSLALFVSSSTIGDSERGALVDQCIASLRVG